MKLASSPPLRGTEIKLKRELPTCDVQWVVLLTRLPRNLPFWQAVLWFIMTPTMILNLGLINREHDFSNQQKSNTTLNIFNEMAPCGEMTAGMWHAELSKSRTCHLFRSHTFWYVPGKKEKFGWHPTVVHTCFVWLSNCQLQQIRQCVLRDATEKTKEPRKWKQL